MTALNHAMDWVNGELVEGRALIVFGSVVLGCSALLWRFGATSAPRALVLPLLVIGVLIVAVSAAMEFNNARRLAAYEAAWELDSGAFVAREIARVRSFMNWYLYTYAAGSLLLVAGVAVFLLHSASTVRAIGLSLILLGTVALYVDFFSQERASRYLDNLVLFEKRPPD